MMANHGLCAVGVGVGVGAGDLCAEFGFSVVPGLFKYYCFYARCAVCTMH